MSVGTQMLHPSQLAILPATKDRGLNNFVGWARGTKPNNQAWRWAE